MEQSKRKNSPTLLFGGSVLRSTGWTRITSMLRRVATLGIRRSVQGALSLLDDVRFDRRYGVDTLSHGDLDSLDVTDASRAHAVAYAPTKRRHFAAVMRACSFPDESVFVDIGSGKGKVLMLASRYDFKRVVGIEFSPDLCRVARTNLAAYERRVASRCPVDVIEADAADYQFGTDESVIFLFNPFGATILKRLVDNLEESLDRHPRRVWVIYNYPRCRSVFDSNPRFRLERTVTYGNTDSLVYTSTASHIGSFRTSP